MDQAVAESLTATRRFDLATGDDVPEIRRLLRENAMGDAIQLSMEPPAGAPILETPGALVHQTIVGRRDDRTLFGAGTRSVSMAYVNGQPMPLGYLGGLRLDADHRARPRVVVQGYQLFRELHEADRATPIYLTSIMSDNVVARRLLEANLRGMPTYRFIGEFVTLIFRRGRNGEFNKPSARARHDLRRINLRLCHAADAGALAVLFNRCSRQFQFARVWSPSDFADLTLRIASDEDRLLAAAGMWDRRIPKQIMVRGYRPAFAWARPMLNLLAPITRLPNFPRVGQPLRCAFLTLAGIDPQRVDTLVPLVRALHASAHSAGVDCFIAGAAAGDPRLRALRDTFGRRELRSRLYVVFWPDGRDAADALDGRLSHPEVALL